MDVSRRTLTRIAFGAILVLALVLRLRGIHNPIIDHPGWRQGDTAAIARNFATLQFNPLFPQTDYNGPPPNYVELELQIVPFLAAIGYKLFGVHEVFGRLISIAFSIGTVALLYGFARRLFVSEIAAIAASLLFAVYPGSMYYGRTFMPDTTMVFFLTAALWAATEYLRAPEPQSRRLFWIAAVLTALAFLAKPVALLALVPLAAMMLDRFGVAGAIKRPSVWGLFAVALIPLVVYDKIVGSHAEWHWASQITTKHVIPSLLGTFRSPAALWEKLRAFKGAFEMLWSTMLGPIGFVAFVLALVFVPPRSARALVFGWLAGALLYAFVVVTVERVDYYLYPFLPLAALVTGGAIARLGLRVPTTPNARYACASLAVAAAVVLVVVDSRAVAPYYRYSFANYRYAKALDARLDPHALVVMGHYDPSILYYINRKGWEEDPYLWTAFNEQSAIRKGARYFIAIEKNRFARNVELAAWMERFPVMNAAARWPVYETDYTKLLPGAEARWQEFRRREKAGLLDQPNLPRVPPSSAGAT